MCNRVDSIAACVQRDSLTSRSKAYSSDAEVALLRIARTRRDRSPSSLGSTASGVGFAGGAAWVITFLTMPSSSRHRPADSSELANQIVSIRYAAAESTRPAPVD